MSLAEKLVILRKQKGLTQMDLAERLNVSRQAISRWEVGAAVPSTENLRGLGDLYGVSVGYFLDDDLTMPCEKADSQEENQTGSKRKFVGLVLAVCVLLVSIVIGMIFIKPMNRDQRIPIGEINQEEGDDIPPVTFSFD